MKKIVWLPALCVFFALTANAQSYVPVWNDSRVKIKPAVNSETSVTTDRNANNAEFVEKVASLNVRITKKQILKNSPILKEMIEKGEIALVGGMYDVETGIVDFYDDEIVTQETISEKATIVQYL